METEISIIMQKTPCSPEVQCDGILYIVIVLEMEDF